MWVGSLMLCIGREETGVKMRKRRIFEAILNQYGVLCTRIPGLDPVIGSKGTPGWVPVDRGRGFWKRTIRVLRQECNTRFGV